MRVDLEDVLKEKSPSLYKKTPRFVIAILKKIIKQNQINDTLAYCSGMQGVEFLENALNFMGIEREYVRLDELDGNKRYLFASNHPLGGLDGLVILEGCSRVGVGAKIVVNDVLMAVKPLHDCFIPINKYGVQSQTASVNLNNELASDKQIIFFPAGLCSRMINGKITDPQWKRSFLTKAIESQRDIVPVYVDNVNSKLFYGVTRFCKWIGIKANVGMVLLPSQMFSNHIKKIRIVYGKPISYKDIAADGDLAKWTEIVRRRCYELKNIK